MIVFQDYYLNYIDNSFYDHNKIGTLELEDWQVIKVAEYAAQQIDQLNKNAVCEIDSFLNAQSKSTLSWNLPLPLSEISKDHVWEALYNHLRKNKFYDFNNINGDYKNLDFKSKIMTVLETARSIQWTPIEQFLRNFGNKGNELFIEACKEFEIDP